MNLSFLRNGEWWRWWWWCWCWWWWCRGIFLRVESRKSQLKVNRFGCCHLADEYPTLYLYINLLTIHACTLTPCTVHTKAECHSLQCRCRYTCFASREEEEKGEEENGEEEKGEKGGGAHWMLLICSREALPRLNATINGKEHQNSDILTWAKSISCRSHSCRRRSRRHHHPSPLSTFYVMEIFSFSSRLSHKMLLSSFFVIQVGAAHSLCLIREYDILV